MAATRAEVLKVYKDMLRESGKFSFYNYRYGPATEYVTVIYARC